MSLRGYFRPPQRGSFRRLLVDDFSRGDFKRTLRRDLRDLYGFYLDEDARKRLAASGRLKRWVLTLSWLTRGLFFRLTPARRILLLFAVFLFVMNDIGFTTENFNFHIDTTAFAFLIVVVILLLELKDKLLAHDELETGRRVQMSLLPTEMPSVSGWDIYLFTRSANDVGGDLVDYLPVGGRRVALVLGDVAGKGLGAALLMAKLQATFRAIATDTDSLAELGARLNSIFLRDQVQGRFATLAYLEIVPDSGTVRVMNAGHLPAVRLSRLGATPMEPQAPPIGLLPDATYSEERVDLEEGNSLVVYSDGVTEARDSAGAFFGDERLLRLLPELHGLPARAAVERVLGEVAQFVGEEPYADDVSLIVLRRLHGSETPTE